MLRMHPLGCSNVATTLQRRCTTQRALNSHVEPAATAWSNGLVRSRQGALRVVVEEGNGATHLAERNLGWTAQPCV